jgi:hypothetical protein
MYKRPRAAAEPAAPTDAARNSRTAGAGIAPGARHAPFRRAIT